MKVFLSRYKHAWTALYIFIYLPVFFWIEKTFTSDYEGLHIIHCPLDDKIPFVEHFIVPYLIWFGYVAIFVLFFFFKDAKEYYKMIGFLFSGMTLFLIISIVYPNGLMIRPTEFVRDNIFTDLVKQLHSMDTDTNVFPSIHAFNSIAIAVAVLKSKHFKNWGVVKVSSTVLAILIIISTVFLKQHSVIDLVGAFVIAVPLYFIFYKKN